MAGQFELGSKHLECIKQAKKAVSEIEASNAKEAAKNLLARSYGQLPSGSEGYNDYLGLAVSLEEIAKNRACAASILVEQVIAKEIFKKLSESNFEDCVSSNETVGILCSEPGFSDICELSTKATKVQGAWQLEGTKLISDEQLSSDKYLVFAKDEELNTRIFLVPESDVKIREVTKNIASAKVALNQAEINVQVDESACIAVADEKYEKIQTIARTMIAAASVGLAHSALENSVVTAKQTTNCKGESITTSQSLQFTLADMFAEVEAARLVTYLSADSIDKKAANIRIATIAKIQASEAASKVTMDALQILGNIGYLANADFAPLVQRAVDAQVKGGTNRSQKSQLYKYMLAKK